MSITTNFFNQHPVRFINQGAEILINANDVMAHLGYKEPKKAWYKMKPRIVKLLGEVSTAATWFKGREYPMSYLNKEQLIAVILKAETDVADDFFKWAICLINKQISKTLEEVIQDQIMDLASYSTIKLRKEVSVINNLTDQTAETRRYDIIQKFGKTIRIYELKARTITLQDVYMTLGIKGYMHLANTFYPNKKIDFVFLSPGGITPEAQRMIDQMPNVRYMAVRDLMNHLLDNIRRNTPPEAHWYIADSIITRYPRLLSPLKVNQVELEAA